MSQPIRVLLQTTIPTAADDWHIGRFSQLAQTLAAARGTDGAPLFEVSARDRGPVGQPDPVLSTLDRSGFDQLWLFAVDVGDGLHDADCEAIGRFRGRGGGVLVARDHMDLGCSICSLAGIGAANYFHTHNLDPDPARRQIDDRDTAYILWPNFHSGANGDWQHVVAVGEPHPVLHDPDEANGVLAYLPSHPHEGAVDAPAGDASARVIAQGRSRATGQAFNLAVAFESKDGGGRAIAQSTFHHFADYNWDPRLGCPSFVSEAPGDAIRQHPHALDATRRYVRNVALWLAGRDVAVA
ncbi:hypothetical protein ISN75_09620 [Dyella marensis]|uniref:hypothetical protein n=1 Tax=Dyella marensis TaxID=500610 RepID=UPI0031D41ECB